MPTGSGRGRAATAARAAPSGRPRRCGTARPSRRRPPGRLRRCARGRGRELGARTLSRPIWARVAPSWAWATRTRASAASRVAFWSRSALLMKPRPTSASARSSWSGRAGVGARHLDLGGELCRLLRLDRAIDDGERLAGADPLPASTSTRTTWPPWPAMPTGMSRRAASGPLAVIVRADLAAAGHDEGDRRHLARALRRCALGLLSRARVAPHDDRDRDGEQGDNRRGDENHAPLTRAVDDHQRVGTMKSRFPVHHSLLSFANPAVADPAVLRR